MTSPLLTVLRVLAVSAISVCLHAQLAQPLSYPKPAPITFPNDLYDHPNTGTEWWYYVGNLESPKGRPYGFELTFFRSYAPTGLPAPAPQVVPVVFADLAVSDIDGQQFFFHKALATLPSATAGIQEHPWSIRLGDWTLHEPGFAEGLFRLKAHQGDFGLDLDLLPEQAPVLNGDKGLFILDGSDGQGDESYEYYSYPRLLTAGTLEIQGETIPVTGLSWNDHEFFTLGAKQTFPGWDWFSIQLSDRSSLMLYGLRLPNGQYDPASRGTYVAADGRVVPLKPGDFTLIPGTTWHSAASGADYPIAWSISIPRLDIQLNMSTPLLNQEMLATPTGGSPTYWEGASRFEGRKRGQPVHGKGYLEMLGYAPQ